MHQTKIAQYLAKHFSNFSCHDAKTFSITGTATLDISVSCPVAILPSTDGKVYVEIDGAAGLDHFNVSQNGDVITVEQKSADNSSINISIGGGVSASNGSIAVGVLSQGIVINNDFSSGKSTTVIVGNSQPQQHKIRIFAPEGSNLDANISGEAELASEVPLNDVEVNASGESFVVLTANNFELGSSGESSNDIIVTGGELRVDTSGPCSLEVQGDFSNAHIKTVGAGSIITKGTCTGNYKASVAGVGSITHAGEVHGQVKKSISGMGSISI